MAADTAARQGRPAWAAVSRRGPEPGAELTRKARRPDVRDGRGLRVALVVRGVWRAQGRQQDGCVSGGSWLTVAVTAPKTIPLRE